MNGFFQGLVVAGRPLFQCCICVERYLAIVYPIAFLKYRARRYRAACLPTVCGSTLGVLRRARPGEGERGAIDLTKRRAFLTVLVIQSASCVERYLAVVHPIAFLKTRTPKYLMYKVICSGATWLVTLGFCGYFLQFFPAFPSEMLCVPFITVLVSASFCSFFIIRALRRPGPGDGKREGMHKMNIKALKRSASCVERYLAVVYPIAFLKTRTPKYLMYKVICSGATWLVTLGFCGYVLKFFPAFPSEMLCAPFITVLVSASFCSFFIIRALRRPGPGDGKREGMHKMNIKALRRVGIYLLLLMISCLPIVSMGILKPFLPCNTFCVGYNVAFAIILGSCTGQPMILLYRAGKLPHPRCHSTSLIQLA
ncbi:hypothetical protein AAFF_G00077470 [Aldrovandia affinis]|uniref:G-protein coupled receptors family 1 profile domain-containing protein n=1 Tax=Aldrovandia affinis TaxID=143900 RepID=A0AAD7RXM4_9TELE|nr:hypothetical protein AAFF_G00077470 [Aldrovandia affinis]